MLNKPTQFRRTALALAALAACVSLGSAQAASPTATRAVNVSFGDLNLSTDQGTNALYARLTAAAREVCGAYGVDIRNLQDYAAARSCQEQAIAKAVHELHVPQLAARLTARHDHS